MEPRFTITNKHMYLFYNKANIKSQSPLKTIRKILATVPVANSGIPFMPKTTKS
jgi:hypothetical protein